jgi:hypothetical protein
MHELPQSINPKSVPPRWLDFSVSSLGAASMLRWISQLPLAYLLSVLQNLEHHRFYLLANPYWLLQGIIINAMMDTST